MFSVFFELAGWLASVFVKVCIRKLQRKAVLVASATVAVSASASPLAAGKMQIEEDYRACLADMYSHFVCKAMRNFGERITQESNASIQLQALDSAVRGWPDAQIKTFAQDSVTGSSIVFVAAAGFAFVRKVFEYFDFPSVMPNEQSVKAFIQSA